MSSTQQRKFHVIASLAMLASFALITVTLACSLRMEPAPTVTEQASAPVADTPLEPSFDNMD